MAQEQSKRPSKEEEVTEMEVMKKEDTNNTRFRINVQAPEFVPRSNTTQIPVSGYFYPCFHVIGGSANSPDWFFIEDQDLPYWISNPSVGSPNNSSKNVLSDDLQHKIIKQVEFQLSDTSLLANETLAKHMSKDPQGYVPISVIASTKKILTNDNNVLAQALQSSSKLFGDNHVSKTVSNGGKKVKRKRPFTEKDREELQSRTVVVENLPEDHSHQNLEKRFRVAGSVKTVRVCHPQEPNCSHSKGDFFISNKLHALVEYETTEIAERAVEKLNDERNWTKGLRVRLLLRCSPKSVLKNRRSEFDGILDDNDARPSETAEDAFRPESTTETNGEESSAGLKKGWGRGRGKARGRAPNHDARGLLVPSPQSSNGNQGEASPKQSPKGPRMPDGTKGFATRRGKPLKTLRSSTNATNFSTWEWLLTAALVLFLAIIVTAF